MRTLARAQPACAPEAGVQHRPSWLAVEPLQDGVSLGAACDGVVAVCGKGGDCSRGADEEHLERATQDPVVLIKVGLERREAVEDNSVALSLSGAKEGGGCTMASSLT